MIEKLIIDYLTARGLAAFAEEPREATTPPYYVVEKTGGGKTEHLRRATVAVKSYGETLMAAMKANRAVIAALSGLDALDEVTRCELNGDYNFTDTAMRRYRYQAVFDITYYEED